MIFFNNKCIGIIFFERNMKKLRDLTVAEVAWPADGHVLLKLRDDEECLPEIRPGQFVEVRVDGSASTLLRRPISVHFVDREKNELWLLIHVVGEGTEALSRLSTGDRVNVLFPLGNGFTEGCSGEHVLLVGGGVGIAPLLEYGKRLSECGARVTFLLGGRSAENLLQLDMFRRYGSVCVTTEDGSMGEKGFVTQHSVLNEGRFNRISVCGPKPMMMAVARFAKAGGIRCEVSLENMMACGLGACLCCVEKTVRGNVCVCKEGPVFDINELTWQI